MNLNLVQRALNFPAKLVGAQVTSSEVPVRITPVPHAPFTLAVTPNGKTLYVSGDPNLFAPIRTSNNHPGTPIAVGVAPSAFAFAIVK